MPFGALRSRDYRLFWGGGAISHLGAWMQQVAQGWLIYQLTGSALAVGLSGLFLTIPFVTMSFYAGTVIDRVDRRRFLMWIEGLNLAVVIVIATLVATGRVEVWHIYVSNALHALLGSFESPARSSLIRHLVRPEDLMSAISLHSVLRRGTQIVGPALGGIAVATVDVTGAYFIHAGSYVLLLWSLVAMGTTNPPAERSERNPLRSFAEGIGYVRTEAVIATLLLLEGALNFFGSFNPMLVVYAKDIFGVGAEGYGLLQSAGGAGTVAGSLALGAMGDVRHKGRLVIAGGVTFGLAVISFAFCPWFHLALLLLAVAGAADIIMGATRTTIIQLLTRGDMLGRVMSLHAVSTRGIGPSGGFQTGALATAVGVQAAVAIGAIVCIGATLAVGWRVPAVRQFTGSGRRPRTSDDGRGRRPIHAEEEVALR